MRDIFEAVAGHPTASVRRLEVRGTIDAAAGPLPLPGSLESLDIMSFSGPGDLRLEDLIAPCGTLRSLRIGARGVIGVDSMRMLRAFPGLIEYELEVDPGTR